MHVPICQTQAVEVCAPQVHVDVCQPQAEVHTTPHVTYQTHRVITGYRRRQVPVGTPGSVPVGTPCPAVPEGHVDFVHGSPHHH